MKLFKFGEILLATCEEKLYIIRDEKNITAEICIKLNIQYNINGCYIPHYSYKPFDKIIRHLASLVSFTDKCLIKII